MPSSDPDDPMKLSTIGGRDEVLKPLTDAKSILMTFDGSVYPKNPGEVSCSGFCIFGDPKKTGDKEELLARGAHWIRVPNATQNFGEYCGVAFGLQFLLDKGWASGHGKHNLLIQGDSQLVVNQVAQLWKIKNERLRGLARIIWKRLDDLLLVPHDAPDTLVNDTTVPHGVWQMNWVRRRFNEEADEMTHEAWSLYQQEKPS